MLKIQNSSFCWSLDIGQNHKMQANEYFHIAIGLSTRAERPKWPKHDELTLPKILRIHLGESFTKSLLFIKF